VALSQSREQQRIASARLAQILHLDPTIELVPADGELVPIALVETTGDLPALVRQALEARPELKQNQALIAAARETKRGAVYGPLIPSLGVQAFLGEFGGGQGDATGNYGASRDYYIGLSWRIGPGGLFDFSRINASQARLEAAELTALKTSDEVARQVVEGYTRVRSLSDQIAANRQSLSAATETLRLTRERKQLGVGIVLEDIQAQQELVRSRADYLTAIADFNKAQYLLSKVLGNL
jgi:outer membrane protein TolC